MSTLRQHVTPADHYVTLSDAAEDFATYRFYHQLALYHLMRRTSTTSTACAPARSRSCEILEARPH